VINLSTLAAALQTLFTATAAALAARLQLVQRERQFCPAALARGLAFGWLQQPDATLSQLNAFVALAGYRAGVPALSQRLNGTTAAFLLELLHETCRLAFAAQPAALPLLSRFSAVYVLDSTSLSLPAALAGVWPGCGTKAGPTACLKVTACWELLGGLLRLDFLPGKVADGKAPLAAQVGPAGALRLADLGYFDLDALAAQAAAGAYFISRVQPHTTRRDADGREGPLWRFLAAAGGGRIDEWVELGADARLACRLVACRCPARVARKRRAAARRCAVKHGREVTEATLVACGWVFFVTNVPQERLSAREVWVVYRVRWQVELLFKLWKSQGGLSRTRGTSEQRVLCEVYAKMLGLVVRHWLLLTRGGWWLGRSMWKESAAAGLLGAALLLGLSGVLPLQAALEGLAVAMAAAGGVDRRAEKPATFQTLEDPDHDGMDCGGKPPDP
jgi:hypothetical protein